MTDLIERLRALSRYEHSDYSIGDEAAAALEAAREQLDWAVKENDRLLAEGSELTTRAERLAEALRDLLDLPEAASQLRYLDKGIGTATEQAAWLRASAMLSDQEEGSVRRL